MKTRPIYRCQFHDLFRFPDGNWGMEMTILDDHVASGVPAGSSGNTSALRSIDFELGIAITQNSIYQFNPEE